MEHEKIKRKAKEIFQYVTEYGFILAVNKLIFMGLGMWSGMIALDSINPQLDRFKLGVIGMLLSIFLLVLNNQEEEIDRQMMGELPRCDK